MGLKELITAVRLTRELDELSLQIVRKLYAPIRMAVAARVAYMPLAEARGYLRSKARPVVRAEVHSVLSARSIELDWAHETLFDRAMERLVVAVLGELRREQVRTVTRRAA